MKSRLNIICILLLIVFGGYCYNAIRDGIAGGSDATRDSLLNELKPLYHVDITPKEGYELSDSMASKMINGSYLKYQIASIKVEKEEGPQGYIMTILLGLIAMPLIGMIIASVYLFIRLILSIRRKDIFDKKNVFRVRFISITIVLSGIFSLLIGYSNYHIASNSIQLHGYKVEQVEIHWGFLVIALLLAVFAEIYAQAIKLKEEQDLTI